MCSGDPSAQSAEKNFHTHFSVVWISSRSTFVLCTALLTAEYTEYTEGDRAQLEGQQVLKLYRYNLHDVASYLDVNLWL